MGTDFTSIGRSIPRFGAIEKLKGAPVFSGDLPAENPLVLKALRSTEDHAVLVEIDSDEAARLPGVAAIFTARDIPGRNLLGIINKDQPLLAEGKVRCKGEPVALVAAENEAAAEAALAAIEVKYEPLAAVFSPQEALNPEAPLIHAKDNCLATRRIRRGDPESAWAACTSVVEQTYRTGMVEHNYLEPDAGLGFVESDGRLTIYASTQNPHYDQKEVTHLLDVAEDQVCIIQAATGGGFGSKLDLNVQGFIGLALHHLRRPVRYVYTREEAYLATAKRHPLTITLKTGTDAQGRLQAMTARIVCDTGAYASYGLAVTSRVAVHITGPYAIPHVDIESRCVYTNNPFCGAMRGFGTPQAAVAHESQLDLHAQRLGIDPLDIRERNAFQPGAATATGQRLADSVGIGACLEAVRSSYSEAKKREPRETPYRKRGVGVGAMWYGIGNTGVQNPSTARVEMDPEGRVTLYTGCADIGQGSSTVLSQIAAETLGLAPEEIRVVAAHTGLTTNAGATSASRQTYISGNAVCDAASKLADVLLSEAVNRLGIPKDGLRFERGDVVSGGDPGKRISLARLARRILAKGGSLEWPGYFDPDTVPLDLENGQGVPYGTYAYACQVVQVDVDVLTGEVRVEKVVAAHDVGRAIHPENVIGQICGGIAMGIGFGLMEEFHPGSTISMKDYHIPTVADMPEIVPIIIESPEPSGPFGAKGVGEPALIPTAPAILNAIADALGERICTLPANLERVLEASIKGGHFNPQVSARK
jgi:CO/xanthine dehydrogenase Mo-binding subunit